MTRTNIICRSLKMLGFVAATLSLAACKGEGDDGGGGKSCDGAKCDDAEGGDIREDLKEFNDPIAKWLVETVDADGVFEVPYIDMLEQIGKQQGCELSDLDSYVISDELVVGDGGGAFPRVVNTVCSTDRTKADMAFFALSFGDEEGIDLDPRRIEMFAWDGTTREYRFYKTEAAEGEDAAVQLFAEPEECSDCHLTPDNIDDTQMHMTPIMNELSAPWEHWFATPISVNHSVPDETAQAPLFSELAGQSSQFLKSAARLEQTIRAGFNQRVAPARLRNRRNKPADVAQAMSLIRPLFCDEQLTYVTEDGSSGLLAGSSVVDDGFHSVFFQINGQGWPWEWWNDRQLRIDPPNVSDPVNMMAVRGQAQVIYEKQVMSSRALAPEQVLRIKALDWHRAALSDFRCGLFHNALPRVMANPPEITETTRNLKIFNALVNEILTLHKGDFGIKGDALPDTIPIIGSEPDQIVMIDVASPAAIQALADALAGGTIADTRCEDGGGTCQLALMDVGALVEVHFKAMEAGGRAALHEIRNNNGCQAIEHYGAKPFIPDPNGGGELKCAGSGSGDDGGVDPSDDGDPSDSGGDSTGGDSTGGDPTAGDGAGTCCEARPSETGCSNSTVEACVCDQDDFCCMSGWDQTCVDEVAEFGCEPSCA